MRQREVTRRVFARTTATALAGAVLWPSAARASIFGEETAALLAILGEMIEQVAQAAKTVQGVWETVNHLQSVVQQGGVMLTKLQSIDGIGGLLAWARDAVGALRHIDRDVTKLGYQIGSIDQQYHAVFKQGDLERLPSSDFKSTARDWNTALAESSAVAMRAQTSIESLELRSETQQEILSASRQATGVVGQLEAVVTNLSLLHADLNALELNLAAGMRVTSTWAGEQSARNSLAEEDHRRMLEGYTHEDPPDAVLTELP